MTIYPISMNKTFSLTLINILILLTAFSMLLWFFLLWRRKIYNIVLSRIMILDNYAYFNYLLLSTSLILMLLLLLLLINRYMKKNIEKTSKFSIFSEYCLKFSNQVNIFYKSYSIIVTYFGTGSPYILLLIALAKEMQKFKYKSVASFIKAATIMPRMIICLVFIIEIYLKTLHYYYYSLFLLIIYVFFKFSIFAFDDLSERILPEAEAMLEMNIIEQKVIIPNNKRIFSGIGLKFKPEFADRNLDYFLHTFYYPLLYLDGYLNAYIKPTYVKYTIISRLIYYFIHTLGFSYILFYIT